MTVAASAARAQERAHANSDDYLVRITQRWGQSSPLGALPARSMGADDVELRVWGGYGLGGSYGVILRRTSGRWQAWRARVVTCLLDLSTTGSAISDSSTDSVLFAEARRHCSRFAENGGIFRQVDTLALEPADARNAGTIWEQVLDAGVLELPPRVPRKWIMIDGCTIVIEVRRGQAYRVSRIEAIKAPEVDADRVAREIHRMVMSEYGLLPEKRP